MVVSERITPAASGCARPFLSPRGDAQGAHPTASSILTSRKMDMPLDSCRAELSSSEELLEDGEVSRESSILWSPEVDRRRPTGRDAAAPTWRCLSCCLPALGCEWVFAPRAPPSAQRGLSSLSRPSASAHWLSPPPSHELTAPHWGSDSSLHLATMQLPLPGSISWLWHALSLMPKGPWLPQDTLQD